MAYSLICGIFVVGFSFTGVQEQKGQTMTWNIYGENVRQSNT